MEFLKLDFDDMERAAYRLGAAADQIDFIMASAMNNAVKDTKRDEEDEMERSIDRPTPFTRKAFYIQKANKKNLTVVLAAKDIQNEYLSPNVYSGTRAPKKKALVVPGKHIKLNKFGNMPPALIKKEVAKGNVFVGKPRGPKRKPAGIYRRMGGRPKKRGGGTIRLIALFSGAQKYKKRFDFPGVFVRSMSKNVQRNMQGAVVRAMSTRRRR